MNTDYIDLYFYHKPDPHTPIEETLRALDRLVQDGKVRYIGSSNLDSWQMVEAEHLATTLGVDRFICAQVEWNLLERRAEGEIAVVSERYGIGLMPYFPLASGLLTGKYARHQPIPQDARLSQFPQFAGVMTEHNLELVERLSAFAEERGRRLIELAMSWLASHAVVSSVLFGATSPGQVLQNVEAAEWHLSDAELREIDVLAHASA